VRLASVAVSAVRIPFVAAFGHAATIRARSESILVRVGFDGGAIGFGEGAPRPYVTGESVASALEALRRSLVPRVVDRDFPTDGPPVPRFARLLELLEEALPTEGVDVSRHASARAALEMALLDGLLRQCGESLSAMLPPTCASVRYSGVVGAGTVVDARRAAEAIRALGLGAVKVKVGAASDVERLAAIREVLGRDVRLRADANRAWSFDEARRALDSFTPFGLEAIEDPLRECDPESARHLREWAPVALVLDEPVASLADLRRYVAAGACDVVNVRVSKCGGLAPSLAIAALARRHGVRVQVGCHVGETAILSAAGRHLAAALPDLFALEGSFGTRLLREDVTVAPVGFGRLGEASLLTGAGLGIEVREDVVRRHATAHVALLGNGAGP
jgi:muconate cycloisomerase